ncbi:hypothetical protein JNW88_00270 [Micromonospora sp. ATA32]|nr:hypothetical protein [Micromonospora sp. ATA32]
MRCTGRALDGRGRAAGEQCGRTFTAKPRTVIAGDGDPRFDVWGVRPPTPTEQDTDARAAGWRIGPTNADGTRHAMCPRCSRPDPTTAALCRDLDRSHT